MPKKKRSRKAPNPDFTIHDSANAPKPVTRLKKSCANTSTAVDELAWDQINTDLDIVEEVGEDGTRKFVSKKHVSKVNDELDTRPGIMYPEILFYLISSHIEPEQIGSFAGINRACYACTKRETFWRNLYQKYCRNHPRLPDRLKIENSFRAYGLRQRVIRALFHTHKVFLERIQREAAQDSKPHQMVGRRCVTVWFCAKGLSHWSVYFKLKKLPPQRPEVSEGNMIEELERIDANPEDNCQVLEVTCQSFHEIPPLMGMTLNKVSVVLAQGFRHHKLLLGFSTSSLISKNILPETSIVLDTVVKIFVFDWWHPRYPHFDNKLPSRLKDEESLPVLTEDFFNFDIREGDL